MKNLAPGTIVRSPLDPEPLEVITTIPLGTSLKLIAKGIKTGRLYDQTLNPTHLSQYTVSQAKEGSICEATTLSSGTVLTRYSRSPDAGVWLEASHEGFVGAIIDSMLDGRDRAVLAWPSRPDNGFVATALALRETRATNKLSHATIALWPWRSSAMHAARSILVNAEDIWQAARRKPFPKTGHQPTEVSSRLAQESLCLVEVRLRDLLPSKTDQAKPQSVGSPVCHPTLLETTTVFAPSESHSEPVYRPDPEQFLKRVRRHRALGKIREHIATLGDPLITPFALLGLNAENHGKLARCLGYQRFAAHGLDAVIIDLTRITQRALAPDWHQQLSALLSALAAQNLPQRPPIVILCEDAFSMRRAELVVKRQAEKTSRGRRPLLRHGALLLEAGILKALGTPKPPQLPPLAFDADIKGASLAPLRDRFIQLSRRLREVGHFKAALKVGRGLHALSTFASLPLGIKEAKENASVLFEGDGYEEVSARSSFFLTNALQQTAEGVNDAPEFEADIRGLTDAVITRVSEWDQNTPVSLKLTQLLSDSGWNAPDVLLVLPAAHIADVFKVSDRGMNCTCSIVDAWELSTQVSLRRWRRIVVVRPEPYALRTLLTAPIVSDRILLLGDAAGASLTVAEIRYLISIADFSPLRERATALATALIRGGAEESMELNDLEYRYRTSTTEPLIDLTKTTSGYNGEVIHLHLESGGRIAYRPGSDVLVFTPDEVRAFRRVTARDVETDDIILVLRKDIRDKLSEALSRSRKTADQLRQYHGQIARFRRSLPGHTLTAKARHVLSSMRAIDPSIGDHELPNIKRWLFVEPSDSLQQPRAARDPHRFSVFMEAAQIDKDLAKAYWEFAILPVRRYRIEEGQEFNRRVVQFIVDPEGVTAGIGWSKYDGLWQAVSDSVDRVIKKEYRNG